MEFKQRPDLLAGLEGKIFFEGGDYEKNLSLGGGAGEEGGGIGGMHFAKAGLMHGTRKRSQWKS